MSDVVKQYPEWFLSMMQDLCDMRDAQRSYFAQPNDHRLKISKVKEAKADQYIEKFVTAGLIAHKEPQDQIKPPTLF